MMVPPPPLLRPGVSVGSGRHLYVVIPHLVPCEAWAPANPERLLEGAAERQLSSDSSATERRCVSGPGARAHPQVTF